jgi:hypothetical protein
MTFVGQGFGERLRSDLAHEGLEVECAGHVAEADAVKILRTCFALYLNYPFAARDAVLRETSFPTKLGTYVLAARPLLVHAPSGTTLAPLAHHKGYAHFWTTMREVDGEALLARMWRTPSLDGSAHAAADVVLKQYFDFDQNRRSMMAALDALVPS